MDANLIASDETLVVPVSKSNNRPSLLRPAGARPAPLGPRTRQLSGTTSPSTSEKSRNDSSSQRNSVNSKISSQSRESTLYSPGPSSPSFPPPASPLRSEYDHQALSGIEERLPTSNHVSQPPSIVPSREPSPIPSIASSHLPPAPAPSSARRTEPSASLTRAPQIKFEAVQVAWKGLPLEAALWMFDSKELQAIVSRAIRSSASESFIRLLSGKELDESLPAELERLTSAKITMQARYRFHVQRRTMLLQALMSFTSLNREKDGGVDLVGKLASQISDTTAECDKLTMELVSVTDQIMQINKLIQTHWTSALAIALRKLNGSYGKRTAELLETRAKVDQLQAELNDAWNEATKLAQEMDDQDATGAYSAVYSDEDDEIMISRAAVVAIPQARPQDAVSAAKLIDLKPTHTPAATYSPPPRPVPSVPEEAEVEEGNTIADDDAVSVKSKRSARSVKSEKSMAGSNRRVSLIAAARTRSMRTSLGSLRIPGQRRKLSLSSSSPSGRGTPAEEPHPPVPAIPKVFSPVTHHPSTSFSAPSSSGSASKIPSASPSFLNLGSRNVSLVSLVDETVNPPPVPKRPRRTEIDDISLEPNSAGRQLSIMDDIVVMPNSSSLDHGIETVPRFLRKSVDDGDMTVNSRRKMGVFPDTASSAIPSIWLNADAPKTPAERVEALRRSSTTRSSYSRLKGITKRYSLPFPFTGKNSRPSSSKSDFT